MAVQKDTPAAQGGTIEIDDLEVTSNSETEAQMRKNFESEGERGDVSTAASKLGKRGGEATARARSKKPAEKDDDEEAGDKDKGKPKPKPKKKPAAEDEDDEDLDRDEHPGDIEGDSLDDDDEDEDEDGEGEVDNEQDLDEDGKPRHRRESWRARMLAATRAESKAKKERNRLAAENDEIKKRLEAIERGDKAPAKPGEGGQPPAGPVGEVDDDPEPQEDGYPTQADYLKDVAKWSGRQEVKKAEVVKQQKQEENTYAQSVVGGVYAFEKRVKDAIDAGGDPSVEDKIPSFKEVLASSTHMLGDGQKQTSWNIVNDRILESERPLEVMLYLASRPDAAKTLRTMPPGIAVDRAMTKIEAWLEFEADRNAEASGDGGDGDGGDDDEDEEEDDATPPSPKKPASNARPPLRTPPRSSSGADPDEINDEDDFDTHVEKANRADAKKRRAGRG